MHTCLSGTENEGWGKRAATLKKVRLSRAPTVPLHFRL